MSEKEPGTAYRKGGRLSSDHVITERGEFGAIASDYGLPTALTCWVNTHPGVACLAGAACGACAALGIAVAVIGAI